MKDKNPYFKVAKEVAMAVVAVIVLLALMIMCSCAPKKRVASTVRDIDRSKRIEEVSRAKMVDIDSTIYRHWREQMLRDLSRSIAFEFESVDSTAALRDSSGRETSPARIIKNKGRFTMNETGQMRKDSSGEDTAHVTSSSKDTTHTNTSISADTDRRQEEQALPVERNAMWRFFTVVVLVGVGVFAFLKFRRR